MADPLLSMEAVDTYYGRSHVLQNVSLGVAVGSVAALLGRNGAGKSTALKSIMGIVAAARGTIRFAGEAIEHLPAHRIARRGIAYVPEDRGIFASLTVEEHLSLNRRPAAGGRRVPVEALYERFPLLAERRRNRGNELSGGEQQMLAIARAITLSPRLLILDEPTEGLAPIVVEHIAGIVHDLRAAGMTMLLVEQNYPFAIGLAEHVYVLGKGRIRWHGTAAELERSPEVRSTWLGV
ncbi:MAG: ABC transporter ATP-binding protein [Spirochaetaceae bacterium]|nr:ABC transporter ATP-binding protein [Spirochaetaceae bacterium]